MEIILKGKEVADVLNQNSSAAIMALKEKRINPTLALVRVGSNPDDLAYEASIIKKAQSMGIQILGCDLSLDVGQKELESHIAGFNQDPYVHGILLFRPLPAHMDEQAVLNMIDPEKDVDGVSRFPWANLCRKPDGLAPAQQNRSWQF
jgi:methylenetetrahydrofolate dehydrogenase (NADP+)/methenyltetrahydrofolate cyclohydrolase